MNSEVGCILYDLCWKNGSPCGRAHAGFSLNKRSKTFWRLLFTIPKYRLGTSTSLSQIARTQTVYRKWFFFILSATCYQEDIFWSNFIFCRNSNYEFFFPSVGGFFSPRSANSQWTCSRFFKKIPKCSYGIIKCRLTTRTKNFNWKSEIFSKIRKFLTHSRKNL